jgi:hypothetical protein
MKIFKIAFSAAALLLLIQGCGGNTDGGDSSTPDNPTAADAGTINFEFPSGTTIRTGDFKGFRVRLRDADGAPATGVRVTCDTENSLALIEPTSGAEQTDGNGEMSGRVGCANPGSYVLACRSGSPGLRATETIICDGNRPAGFTGFPGAGGGGLGGGSADNDTISNIRVTSVSVSDDGTSTGTTSIDINQDLCRNSSNTPTPEPFFDTSVTFNLTNNTRSIIKITQMEYRISSPAGGSAVTSGRLNLTGNAAQAVDSNGGTGTVSSLLFDAASGGKSVFRGPGITSSGFKNIVFTLYGENELGEKFTVKTSTALSFDNFNRCSS